MDWLKCNICFNTYNDTNLRPRVLSCGHSFCERCLKNTIQNSTLTCPQCRKIHEISSVVDLPINFIVEGLLKSLNPCSQDVSKGAISGPIREESDPDDRSETCGSLKTISEQEKSLSSQKELLKESAGMCNEHPNNELIFRCSSHKCWVCEKCIEGKGDHPKDYCSITSFKEEIEDRRQEHTRYLDNKEKSCNETLHVIEKHISDLSEKREHHISLVDALQGLMNMHKNEDKSLQNETKIFEKIIENGNKVKQRLLDVTGTVQNAATLDESNAVRDLVENMNTDTRNWIKTSEKEIDEGKEKLQRSTNLAMATKSSLENKENNGLLLQELDANIIQLQQNQQLENRINSKDNELMKKNESRISKARNYDVCSIHRKTISYRCVECHIYICDACLEFHSNLIGCSTITSTEAMESMKEKQFKSTDTVLTIFDKNVKYMSLMIHEHIDKKKELLERAEEQRKELLEKAEKHGKEVKRLSSLLKLGNLHKKKMLECKENLSEANSPYIVRDQIEVLTQRKQSLRSWNLNSLGTDVHIDLLMALKGQKCVNVKMVLNDEERYAKIAFDEKNIYIHTFRAEALAAEGFLMPSYLLDEENKNEDKANNEDQDEDKEDSEDDDEDEEELEEVEVQSYLLDEENKNEDKANNEDQDEDKEDSDDDDDDDDDDEEEEEEVEVQFDCMQKMIPEEISLVFLQLCIGEIVSKHVHIRLNKSLPHIRENIVQIFSGQKGPSFYDLKLSHGKYNLSTESLSQFEEIPVTHAYGGSKAKVGDVIADYTNGYLLRLFLIVKPYDYSCGSMVIGTIEKGLDIIQGIHSKLSDRNIEIYNCGLVIEQE